MRYSGGANRSDNRTSYNSKREAKKDNSQIIYGERCCLSVIENKSRPILQALISDNTSSFIIDLLENDNIPTKIVERAYLNRLCKDSGRHQDIILKTGSLYNKMTLQEHIESKKGNVSCFLLDQIQDPHNIGAIIRSSYCFNIDFLIVSEKNMPSVNATIVRTSTGLSEILPIYIFPNLTRSIDILREYDFWVFGLENTDKAQFVRESLKNFSGNKAFILGSEGYGISKNLQNQCDGMLKIPIKEGSDSLNVSNAAAIVAYESYLA